MGAWWRNWAPRGGLLIAGLMLGGIGVYLVRPALPFNPDLLLSALTALGTVGAVSIAVLRPLFERSRQRHAIRIRALGLLKEITAIVTTAKRLRIVNSERALGLAGLTRAPIDDLCALGPQLDVLTPPEMMAILHASALCRALDSPTLDPATHGKVYANALDAVEAAAQTVIDAEEGK